MATITAALVKELREKTGSGMMDCKTALSETNGEIEAAVDWLRKKGLAKAAKKSGRIAADGLVGAAVEANFGVVVEVNSETDFVARNDDFQALVRGILAVAIDKGASVDAEAVRGAHFPGGGTVEDAIANAIATIGENITLRRAAGAACGARRDRPLRARPDRRRPRPHRGDRRPGIRKASTMRSSRSAGRSRCTSPPPARSPSTPPRSTPRSSRGRNPCSRTRTRASRRMCWRRSSSPA